MKKPHAVCVPFPAQGHISPMLMVAKLLHAYGFHITFVLTEFSRRRLIRSSGEEAVEGIPGFHFGTIPDGLPYSDDGAMPDIPVLCDSTTKYCLPGFRHLLSDLMSDDTHPPASCIVGDGVMTFTLDAARELGVPAVLFWTASACSYLGYIYYRQLIDRGVVPLKDLADITNGFLDMEVDWVPGLMKGMRLKDFPSFLRTVDAGDVMLNFVAGEVARASMASAIILNTFEGLDQEAVNALEKILPPIYSVGPLSLLSRRKIPDNDPLAGIGLSLWKKDDSCLEWLKGRKAGSVVYVNFGSLAVMTSNQLAELAWGLADSGYDFLWMVRPDLLRGELPELPPEFFEQTAGRGLMSSWCAQEDVLWHPAVGGFLTHCGWNSTVESISAGVPMICWPFFGDQQTNCRYACSPEWGVGVEIDGDVKREVVEGVIREMMAGEQGANARQRGLEWKEMAAQAIRDRGISEVNFERMIKEILLDCKKMD